MPTIVTPVDAAGDIQYNANCYVSFDEANAYLEDITEEHEWPSGQDEKTTKERLLIRATKREMEPLLARQLADCFDDVTPQPLMFPRSWDTDPDTGLLWVPPDIRHATALLAVWLYGRRGNNADIVDAEKAFEQRIQSFATGDLTVSFGRHSWRAWPSEVKLLFAPYWRREGRTTEGPGVMHFEGWRLPGMGPVV